MTGNNGKSKLSDFRPQRHNANRGKAIGLTQLDKSMRRDGYSAPMVAAADGEIFAGSKRLERAADVFGLDATPIIVHSDGTRPIVHVRDDIPTGDDPRAVRLGVADNAIAHLDYDPDGELLAALAEQDAAIAEMVRLDDLSAEAVSEAAGYGDADAEPQIDRAEELNKKWKVKTGDLWRIGEHRLLCGDSTRREDVERVMGGERAILFATDPPYGANAGNIGFTAQRDDIEAITKDNLEGKEMQAFLESAFRAWIPSLCENAAWYLWHPMLTQGYFAAAAAAADLIIHRQIIWVKEQFIFGRGDYHWRHELCFYGWRQGHRPAWYAERNQDTVWNIEWGEKRGEIGHPTAKPKEIFARPMRNHTRVDEVCAEPFAGSGSQFVAGENLKRRVYGCELEPKYCAVILERMSDAFPGIEIERL